MAAGGLIYYPDSNPGITRRRRGRGFSYTAPDGTAIACRAERARLAALAIPPAYDDVWIAPMPNAHLLATGRDARRRKQYRYHPDWAEARAQTKFDRLADVGRALPALRRWITRALAGDIGSQDTAIAAALALIDRAALRPGDPVYTASNGSHGALTLEGRHLTRDGARITLNYTAKGGKEVTKSLTGARLARVLHRCADLPGSRLFDVPGPNGPVPLRSDHIQEVLTDLGGDAITPKSLRTWAGTLAAFDCARASAPTLPTIASLADAAAARLHNTATVARNSYIHPDVIATAEDADALHRAARASDDGPSELRQGEAALLRYLV